ncbi:MAG: S53 family peptidase [Jatrophihabitantaceae bacterium]
MRKSTMAAALTAVSALVASVLAATPSAQAAAPRSVPNTKPAWTAHARHLGKAANNRAVHARVYLAPRGGLDAVRQAAVAMATPGSPSYHRFLTPAQYQARFGVTSATVNQVSSWLRSAGLKVGRVGAHNRFVAVHGTVAQAEKAFSTTLATFRHQGTTVMAPAATLKTPASLSSAVLTVIGLDTSVHKMVPNARVAPPAGFRNAHPCSIYYGQVAARYQTDFKTPLPRFGGKILPYAPCGYTGPQFRAAYENGSTLDGSGATVAITDAYASNYMAQDAATYANNHGDAGYAPGQYQEYVNTPFTHKAQCGPSGWSGEESLDVESVHAMAGGANILYYGSASCYDQDFLNTLQGVVDDNQAQLVSNSWGEPSEGESAEFIKAYEDVFLQGGLQGISFLYSSGDSGDDVASTGLKQTDMPTSDPYVTAVGGTSTGIGPDGSLSFETGWGTQKYSLSSDGTSWNPVGYLYGAGGGYSPLFNRPGYQDGTVHSAYRGVPDVAMDADPNTGMLIGLTQTFSDGVYYDEYRIGGTSLASPLFAGMTALKVQANGGGYGLLNPTIYQNKDTAFTDVGHAKKYPGDVRVDFKNGEDASGGLTYSVRTFDQDASLSTGPGWDTVTGVGSPNSAWLSK